MMTVLTPAYNRAHTLPRLYSSLCGQVNGDFEWLVIDDGSSDSTRALVNGYIELGDINIRYHFQENSGKHVALNAGVNLAAGEWIFIVDSDDALTTDAVDMVFKGVSECRSENIAGVCYRRASFDGVIIGESFPGKEKILMSPTDAGNAFKGDLAYIFKSSFMRAHPFPVIPGERFVPELYVWNRISDSGGIYFFPDKYVYFCDYLEDGYSKNFKENLIKNPIGFFVFYISQVSREEGLVRKIKCIIRSIQCAVYAAIRG